MIRKIVIGLGAAGGLYALYKVYKGYMITKDYKASNAPRPDPLTGGGNQTEIVFTDGEAGYV